MRILLDTNILIYREDDRIISNDIQNLQRLLSELGSVTLVHPLSKNDIEKDSNIERRAKILSKILAYPLLDAYPNPRNDGAYLSMFQADPGSNDDIDNIILYAIYRNAVDFFVTEDRGLHRKALRLSCEDRVLLVDDAIRILERLVQKDDAVSPPALKRDFVYNLNPSDPIFDSLKRDYKGFNYWFENKCCKTGRRCWVHYRDGDKIGALLIYNIEDEQILSKPPLAKKKRFKICTLKVTYIGKKIGELLIKQSVDYCINNDISEIYLTHFVEDEDQLIELISEYGFLEKAEIESDDGRIEKVYVKDLIPERDLLKSLSPLEVSKKYYPNLVDGSEEVNKFIVPIKPEYHDRLFTDFPGRTPLKEETSGEFIVEGNTITKAYLSHSPIRKISPGDILIFYRLRPSQMVTSIGVVDAIYANMTDSDQVLKLVAKRTVYSKEEIEEMEKPILVILFRHHFHFKKCLTFDRLIDMDLIAGIPRSIQQISHENYMRLKEQVGIDGRYTVD